MCIKRVPLTFSAYYASWSAIHPRIVTWILSFNFVMTDLHDHLRIKQDCWGTAGAMVARQTTSLWLLAESGGYKSYPCVVRTDIPSCFFFVLPSRRTWKQQNSAWCRTALIISVMWDITSTRITKWNGLTSPRETTDFLVTVRYNMRNTSGILSIALAHISLIWADILFKGCTQTVADTNDLDVWIFCTFLL